MFCSQRIDTAYPYAVFAIISNELLRLYDNSVWSIRDHISQWEVLSEALHMSLAYSASANSRQRRLQETDYVLLHEIARHGVHVSKTLSVAVQSQRPVLRSCACIAVIVTAEAHA